MGDQHNTKLDIFKPLSEKLGGYGKKKKKVTIHLQYI